MLKIVRVQAIWCSSCLYMSKVWDKVMKNKKDIEVINLDYDLDRDIIKEFKVALITTIGGLIVAIILQMFFNYIISKIDSIVVKKLKEHMVK